MLKGTPPNLLDTQSMVFRVPVHIFAFSPMGSGLDWWYQFLSGSSTSDFGAAQVVWEKQNPYHGVIVHEERNPNSFWTLLTSDDFIYIYIDDKVRTVALCLSDCICHIFAA